MHILNAHTVGPRWMDAHSMITERLAHLDFGQPHRAHRCHAEIGMAVCQDQAGQQDGA
jgi:hypothetical protein